MKRSRRRLVLHLLSRALSRQRPRREEVEGRLTERGVNETRRLIQGVVDGPLHGRRFEICGGGGEAVTPATRRRKPIRVTTRGKIRGNGGTRVCRISRGGSEPAGAGIDYKQEGRTLGHPRPPPTGGWPTPTTATHRSERGILRSRRWISMRLLTRAPVRLRRSIPTLAIYPVPGHPLRGRGCLRALLSRLLLRRRIRRVLLF